MCIGRLYSNKKRNNELKYWLIEHPCLKKKKNKKQKRKTNKSTGQY